MKQSRTSAPATSLQSVTAGRTFVWLKSVKGKGTRTISPLLTMEGFPIFQAVQIRFVAKEVKTAAPLC